MGRRRCETRLLIIGILAICAGGAWISGELVRQHAGNVWNPSAARASLLARACGAAQELGFDCGQTRQSRWAQFRIPLVLPTSNFTVRKTTVVVPLAFLGLAYFVFLGVWFALIGGPRPIGRHWHRLPLLVAAAGALASLGLVGLMVAGVAPWCLPCLVVHVLNLALAVAVWRVCIPPGAALSRVGAAAASSRRRSAAMLTRREVACTVAFALVLVGGLWLYRREHLAFHRQYRSLLPYRAFYASLQNDPAFLLREFHAQPPQPIPPRRGEAPTNGRPQLVVFTDYQCGACYCQALSVQPQIVAAFAGNLVVSIRHYPLCRECNDQVRSDVHPAACQAACAAEAARLQGGEAAFGRMHELLFQHRSQLSEETFAKLAREIGLDADRLLHDMRGELVQEVVAADIALARELGVSGTPAMFLNGRPVPALCRTPVFWQAVAEAGDLSDLDQVAASGERPPVEPSWELPEP